MVMSDIATLNQYFEYLDQIANLELKNRPALQGGTEPRYRLAKTKQGNKPLTGLICEALSTRLNKGAVLLTTGTGNPTWLPDGETDGPSGVAVLARLFGSLGIRSCIVAEARFLPAIQAAVQAAGTPIMSSTTWSRRDNGALCLAFPEGAKAAPDFINELLSLSDTWQAAFFIEKPGPSHTGKFHNSSGAPKDTEWLGHLHLLANESKKRGIPTIGIGDGGNEIGFGMIATELFKQDPDRYRCACQCPSGLLDSTEVDFLFPVSVSNWGAYAIVAALAIQLGRPELMQDWTEIKDSIKAPLAHGAFDGYSGLSVPSVDGVSLVGNQAIYALIQEVVRLHQTKTS
jgi:D-glutamate cyclase